MACARLYLRAEFGEIGIRDETRSRLVAYEHGFRINTFDDFSEFIIANFGNVVMAIVAFGCCLLLDFGPWRKNAGIKNEEHWRFPCYILRIKLVSMITSIPARVLQAG